MEKVKVSQVAKMLGVSLNSVYRKFKQSETKLNGHVTKEGGLTYVSPEGIEILKGLFQKLNLSETPNNKDFSTVKHLEKIISDQQKTLDTLIAQHADERARAAEERQRADTILMKLTNDISTLQKCLEYKKPEIVPEVKVSVNSFNPQIEVAASPIRAVVLESSQREIGFIESVKLGLDDFCGLIFGRG